MTWFILQFLLFLNNENNIKPINFPWMLNPPRVRLAWKNFDFILFISFFSNKPTFGLYTGFMVRYVRIVCLFEKQFNPRKVSFTLWKISENLKFKNDDSFKNDLS